MLHTTQTYRWLAGLCLLSGCQLETLIAEFQMTEPPTASTTGGDSSSSSSGESSESSSSGGSTTDASHGGSSDTTDPTDAHTSTSDTTAASDTTGPTAVCGDGVVDDAEECDDGDRDDLDECDNDCASSWTIFVTAERMYSGNINGLVGADTRCRQQANYGGLPRWDHYQALLSDSTTDAAARLHNARGWYRLVNGLPVAHGWDALMTGPLENPVNVTQDSETSEAGVWTGTMAGGIAVEGATHCMDWMSDVDAGDGKGYWGYSAAVDATWLYVPEPDFNPSSCAGGSRSLYCVEQP